MEWKEVKLGDLYTVHNGLSKSGKYFGYGFPFLTFSDVFKNYFIPEVLGNKVDSSEKERVNYDIKRGDVFITRTSETAEELGMSSVALQNMPNATYNGFTKRLRPVDAERLVQPEFIGYYLRSQTFRNNFYLLSGGMSTRASLSNTDLLNMKVYLPPISTQRRIASILSSLDRKIELNNKINAQLEEMAQAIFKSWFVDFEPFKDGKFVESELGLIPEGWRVGTLGEIADLKAGGDKPAIISSIPTPMCSIPIYSNGIDNEGLYGYTDKANIIEESVTVSARGTIGYVCLRQTPYVPIVRLIAVIPKENSAPKYIYMLLKRHHIEGNGSTQQQLTIPNFKKEVIIIPPKDTIINFERIVSRIFEYIYKNKQQNLHLAQLRDTLLPKLMNGEIEI